ncbi:MAG: hypothetical protein JSS05_07265 [Proteobacteria bacterium]|nr:hypothetical protein [Pseudomonadota bacterium]
MRFLLCVIEILILGVITSNAHADWISKSGERLPDTEYRKSAGAFGAHLILVPDAQRLLRDWDTPSETVEITAVNSVPIGSQANAFVVFKDCTPTKSGQCNVTMQFRVYQPNGKIYASTPLMEVWQDKPAPRMLELSVQYLKIILEPKDLPGKYLVSAKVRDNVSGVSLDLSSAFTGTK